MQAGSTNRQFVFKHRRPGPPTSDDKNEVIARFVHDEVASGTKKKPRYNWPARNLIEGGVPSKRRIAIGCLFLGSNKYIAKDGLLLQPRQRETKFQVIPFLTDPEVACHRSPVAGIALCPSANLDGDTTNVTGRKTRVLNR